MLCFMSLISPNFAVKSIFFSNFAEGPFPKIAGKSPGWPQNSISFRTTNSTVKVSKCAKIRNRYNQVPHLTQDTNRKVTNSQ